MVSGHRRRPILDHKLVSFSAKQQRTLPARVLLHKRIPFRVVFARLGPVHAAVRVDKVPIQRHMVEYDQFPHLASPLQKPAASSCCQLSMCLTMGLLILIVKRILKYFLASYSTQPVMVRRSLSDPFFAMMLAQ